MFTTLLVAALAVFICVFIHLALLITLDRYAFRELKPLKRYALGVIVFICILGHLLEIGVFSFAISFLQYLEHDFLHNAEFKFKHFQHFYYSASAYTSLGGGTPPTIELQIFTAVEALTGLILITWTASFLFLMMQRFWTNIKT